MPVKLVKRNLLFKTIFIRFQHKYKFALINADIYPKTNNYDSLIFFKNEMYFFSTISHE